MSDRGQVLRDALEVINGERQDQYGSPEDSFALIAEYWAVYLRNKIQKERGNIDVNDYIFSEFIQGDDVAYMMTLFKIARENFQHKKDNLVDAAGYLGIAGDMYEDEDQDEIDELFERAAAETWNRDDDWEDTAAVRPLKVGKRKIRLWSECDERTAARDVEDTVRWRQGRPSLAYLVDWEHAPSWATHALQLRDGMIAWVSIDAARAKAYKKAPLAHDWHTSLNRPVPEMKTCSLCDGDGLREYWTTRGEPGREKLVKGHTTCEWCKGQKQVPYWVECTADAKKWQSNPCQEGLKAQIEDCKNKIKSYYPKWMQDNMRFQGGGPGPDLGSGSCPDHTCTQEEDDAFEMMAVRQEWESKPSDVPG